MPKVLTPDSAKIQAAKLGLTAEQLGQLIQPLFMMLYKNKRESVTITRKGLLAVVDVK